MVNFVSLPSPVTTVFNIGSQTPDIDIDVLDLWHRRLADTSHRVIRKAVRNKLIEGITLDQSRKQYMYPGDMYARAKMHWVSFLAVRN